jgi:hypothetical protein
MRFLNLKTVLLAVIAAAALIGAAIIAVPSRAAEPSAGKVAAPELVSGL